MRRSLAVLLALVVAAPSWAATPARVLVVRSYGWAGTDNEERILTTDDHKWAWFQNQLRGFGIHYEPIDACRLTTAMMKTGIVTGGAAPDTFEAVIHWNFDGYYRSNCLAYQPEDLTLAANAPTVPQLMLYTNRAANEGTQAWIDNATNNASSNPCSTGVSGPSAGDGGMVPRNPTTVQTQYVEGFYRPGLHERVLASSYVGAAIRNSTPPAGGIRVLLARGMTALSGVKMVQGVNCAWADSTVVQADPDTMMVWERPMSHVAGAKSIVFAYYMGGSDLPDSTAASYSPCEGEYFVSALALARLDSLLSGRLIQKAPQLALTIDGVASRAGRRHPWGLNAPDSTVLWGTLDSLKALGIPITVGVNVDSTTTYASEVNRWKALPNVRFSPQTRWGLDTTVAGLGNATLARPADPWGRWRQRRAVDGTDTCLVNLLRSGRNRLGLLVGFSRLSATALPTDDDWSPVNALPADSVMYAANLAGYRALRIDGQRPRSGWPAANPRGYGADAYEQSRQRWLNLLAHNGYNLSGGALQWDVRSDSVAPYVSEYISANSTPISYEQSRWWAGLFQTFYWDYDYHQFDQLASTVTADMPWVDVNRPMADRLYRMKRGSVVRLGVNDLAGEPNGPPARWGWWAVKSMSNAFSLINRTAGRTVIGWAYPEDIEP